MTKLKIQKVKDYSLFAYVALTILGAYSWFVFSAGASYGTAHASSTITSLPVSVHTSK